jgi:hypothetical protein
LESKENKKWNNQTGKKSFFIKKDLLFEKIKLLKKFYLKE